MEGEGKGFIFVFLKAKGMMPVLYSQIAQKNNNYVYTVYVYGIY